MRSIILWRGLIHYFAGVELLKDPHHLMRRGRAQPKALVVRLFSFSAFAAAAKFGA